MLPQKGLIDTGFHIEALRPGKRHHVGEVAVALLVFAQQHQMAALAVEFVDLIEPGAALRGHIDLTADDWLDALRLAGPIEVDDAVHNAVISDCHAVHSQLFCPGSQLSDLGRAVQKTVFCMDM